MDKKARRDSGGGAAKVTGAGGNEPYGEVMNAGGFSDSERIQTQQNRNT